MNYFRAQQQARSNSSQLLLLFTVAVICIVVTITATIYLVFGDHQEGIALFSSQSLGEHFTMLSLSAAATLLFIVSASFFRAASLRAGGGQIARDLGGDRVNEDTTDPQLKRLRNVVEEIAIASGIPVPDIYVLEQESAINAFAAGDSLSDAAVAVTRGTLEHLNREELQGVIAHEFSHILNGDMRLNIRLVGLLFGITAIAIVGRKGLYHFRYAAGGSRRGTGGIMMLSFALLAIGSLGLLFARMIKAAVSRQRETLADASAVQFTRNPQGLAGALKKIAALNQRQANSGSFLANDSEEIDHMLFANGRTERWFATHPPLIERIQALEPSFQEGELKRIAANHKRKLANEEAQQKAAQSAPGINILDPGNIISGIGNPHWQQVLYAAVLSQAIPDHLTFAARTPQRAPALILYLLLSKFSELREEQYLKIAQQGGIELEDQVRSLFQMWDICQEELRIPLVELALPALKRRSRRELLEFLQLIEVVAVQKGSRAVFSFMLSRMIHLYLEESLHIARTRHRGRLLLKQCKDEAALVLALLAREEQNLHPADKAYREGMDELGFKSIPDYAPPDIWSQRLIQALNKLDGLRPSEKEIFVRGLLAVAFNDREINVSELELIRAICATLHVPLPPVEAIRAGA